MYIYLLIAEYKTIIMTSHTIIGRSSEKKILEKLYKSKRSEFVAVYGRRRVGNTKVGRTTGERRGLIREQVAGKTPKAST